MADLDNFSEEKECLYKDEHYKVRDNGSVMRLPKGEKVRPLDNNWTFGMPNEKTGYMEIGGERVHRIVAFAFHGNPPSSAYVVDHIDTNRRNNRPENLRWLTKLENILLNDITRSKIEYLCGSVENFLADPSVLKDYIQENTNFSWMRTVSKEEAENTLIWWKKIKDNPRPITQSRGIGEWIYGKPDNNPQTSVQTSFNHSATTSRKDDVELRFVDEDIQKKNNMLESENKVSKGDDNKKLKSTIIAELVKISEVHGWNLEKKTRGNDNKSDILISNNGVKIAININKRKTYIDEELSEYKENGIKAYWFNFKHEYEYNEDNSLRPYFDIENNDDKLSVKVNEVASCTLSEFVEAALANKVVEEKSVTIKDIKIRFEKVSCYKCGCEYVLYVVSQIKIGQQYCYNEVENGECVDEFDPIVIKSVQKYLLNHPEIRFSTDIIKDRYSNTLKQSYPSFGCPQCDALFGLHHLYDLKVDLEYPKDDENVHEIHLEGDGIKLNYQHWTIQK